MSWLTLQPLFAAAATSRRAKAQTRRELHEMARCLDDELVALADEMRGMRNEFYRLKAIEEAEALKLAINEASRSNGSVNVSLLLGIANELARRR
jgi:hypothetical protein